MIKLFSITLLFIFIHISSHSHSGRTNSEGCHNKKSNNTYHCHNVKKKFSKNSYSGYAKVIDGDTIHIGNKKYRLSGIDAPEKNQFCVLNGNRFNCGMLSRQILEDKINRNKVDCIEEDIDRYQRILAECFLNGESLSSFLVKSGYAFAYIKYSKKFIEDEEFARNNNLGLWKTKFLYPWEFRKKNRN